MVRIAGLVALSLFTAQLAWASDTKAPAPAKPAGVVMKMDAEEVFLFVEQTLKDPKIDRAKAQKFLQAAMDGQVRMFEVDVAQEGSSMCIAKKCKTKGCKRCDITTNKCFCSNCCIADRP